MDRHEPAPEGAVDLPRISSQESLEDRQSAFNREKDRTKLAAGAAPQADIADGIITFSSGLFKSATAKIADPVREIGQVFYKRDVPEDERRDRSSVEKELSNKELEAGIDGETMKVLMKDADRWAPIKNDDGSTSYRIVQVGMTNRPIEAGETKTSGKFYTRTIDVRVPAGAGNLGECKYGFGDRREINEETFNRLLDRDRARLKEENMPGHNEVNLHAHGVFTYTNMADQEALLLQLTNGHPTVNVDWQAFPNTRDNPHHYSPNDKIVSSYLHYMEDRASAKVANAELEPLLDRTIDRIGAAQTTMIGFSHGGMFDTRYLRHRVDGNLPKVGAVLFAHPDVPVKTPELMVGKADGTLEGLLSAAASRSVVIGGRADLALLVASWLPGASGYRLGNDSASTRKIIEWNQGKPISEITKLDKKELDQHFLNYSGLASLENGDPRRSEEQMQQDFRRATEMGRRRFLPETAPPSEPAPAPGRTYPVFVPGFRPAAVMP
jgi:hypothetical protein